MPPVKSIVHKFVRGSDGKGLHTIRGATGQYSKILTEAGCVWQPKELQWHYAGKELPQVVKDIIDGLYGIRDLVEVMVAAETPDDTAETDAWVKQVNDAARAADTVFTETMNMSPIVHLAMTDPNVVKANNHFVKVASGGKFKTVEEVFEDTPTSSAAPPVLSGTDVALPETLNLPETPEIESSASDAPSHPQQFITIQCKGDEMRKVSADIIGQLAVHRSTANREKWVITHVASGRTVSANRVSPTDTLALANTLASLFDFDGWLENRVPMSEHDQAFRAGVKAFLDAWDMQPTLDQVKALLMLIPDVDSPLGENLEAAAFFDEFSGHLTDEEAADLLAELFEGAEL